MGSTDAKQKLIKVRPYFLNKKTKAKSGLQCGARSERGPLK